MNAEMKAKWLAALRSGKYKQGSGRLRSADGTQFCCLGVLADVAGAAWIGGVPSVYGTPEVIATLDPKTCGLSNRQQNNLIGMNDFDGLGFYAIADAIEIYIPATEQ